MAFTPETETHEAARIAEEVVASEDADFSPANDPPSSDPSKPEVVESDEKQECAPEDGSFTDDEVARINEASQYAKEEDRTKEEGAKLEQTAPAPAADRKSSWFRPGDSKAILISLLLFGGIVACNLPVTPNLKEADTQDTRLLETAEDAEELDLKQPARMMQFDLESVGLEVRLCTSADA